MFEPHSPEKSAAAREQLRTTFESFSSRIDCGPDEILDWVADNINALSHHVLGIDAKLVDEGSSSWYTRVRVVDDKPYVEFDSAWQYSQDDPLPTPDLKSILQNLPGLEVVVDRSAASELSAKLVFDLTLWPHLVAHVAHFKARFALVDGYGFTQVQDAAMEDVLTLGKFFYPTLTKEGLVLGADLGMLDTVETFRSWCPVCTGTQNPGLTIPQDL